MSEFDYRRIIKDGLWDKNVVFSQKLALCPLLAVTTTATNGLGMGIATTFVMITAAVVISMLRQIISAEVRIPVFILLIASIVTLLDMFMNAYLHELHKVLGLFIALIVTNCVILARAEAFASKNPIRPAVMDGLMMGLGFTFGLVVLGSVREMLGTGTLFANASLLLGDSFAFLETTLIPEYKGMLLMILPTGGFVTLGFLLAAKQKIEARRKNHRQAEQMTNTTEAIAN